MLWFDNPDPEVLPTTSEGESFDTDDEGHASGDPAAGQPGGRPPSNAAWPGLQDAGDSLSRSSPRESCAGLHGPPPPALKQNARALPTPCRAACIVCNVKCLLGSREDAHSLCHPADTSARPLDCAAWAQLLPLLSLHSGRTLLTFVHMLLRFYLDRPLQAAAMGTACPLPHCFSLDGLALSLYAL